MNNIKNQFADAELELVLRITHLMLSRRLGVPYPDANLPSDIHDLRRIHAKLGALFNFINNFDDPIPTAGIETHRNPNTGATS